MTVTSASLASLAVGFGIYPHTNPSVVLVNSPVVSLYVNPVKDTAKRKRVYALLFFRMKSVLIRFHVFVILAYRLVISHSVLLFVQTGVGRLSVLHLFV